MRSAVTLPRQASSSTPPVVPGAAPAWAQARVGGYSALWCYIVLCMVSMAFPYPSCAQQFAEQDLQAMVLRHQEGNGES